MSIRLALACAASVLAFASVAQADAGRRATEIFVSSDGVDFSSPADTTAFYASLKRAAVNACDSDMGRNLAAIAADRQCATASLDRAVRQIGQSSLLAMHESATGRQATTVLAAAPQ